MEKQIYFNAPIELYQHFIENTWQCFDNVLGYCIAEYNTKGEAEEALKIELNNCFVRYKTKGTELRKGKYNGTQFSIPKNILFDFYVNHRTKTERQKAMLLGYLALKSIAGWWNITVTSNGAMFARMAGYPSTKLLPELSALGEIAKYNTPYKMARVRADITDNFSTVNIYSHKGKRGFAIKFCIGNGLDVTMDLAVYMERRTQRYKDKKRREQMEEAAKKAIQQTQTKEEKKRAYYRSLNLTR